MHHGIISARETAKSSQKPCTWRGNHVSLRNLWWNRLRWLVDLLSQLFSSKNSKYTTYSFVLWTLICVNIFHYALLDDLIRGALIFTQGMIWAFLPQRLSSRSFMPIGCSKSVKLICPSPYRYMAAPPSARFLAVFCRFPCTYYTMLHRKSHVSLGISSYSVGIIVAVRQNVDKGFGVVPRSKNWYWFFRWTTNCSVLGTKERTVK